MIRIEKKAKKSIDKVEIVLLIGLLVCFGFVFLYFGIGTYSDSKTYIEMQMTREPLYPLILAFFRVLFGQQNYFFAVGLFQNLLAVCAIFMVVIYIKRQFRTPLLITLAVTGLLLMPYLITPFFAKSGLIISNAILTEGISYSLYYIYFLLLMQMILEKEHFYRYSICSLILAFLLSLLRGQMLVLLLAWCVCSIVMSMYLHRFKQALLVILLTICAIVGKKECTRAYHYFVNGYAIETVFGTETAVPFWIYLSEAEDASLIQDAASREVFEETYAQMETEQLTKGYYDNDLIGSAEALEETHDRIGNIFKSVIQVGLVEEKLECDRIAGQVRSSLFPKYWKQWLHNYIGLAMYGMIRTVAIEHPVLNWYALAIYIIAVIMIIQLFRKNHEDESAKVALVLAMLIGANVFSTAIVIMCLSRYMMYNMPLFYMVVLLMGQSLYRQRKDNEKRLEEAADTIH